MAFNGSGSFTLIAGNPVVTGTTISSTWANNTLSDIATGLSTTITKDGQTTPTANIPMGGYKITGLGEATLDGEALRFQDKTALTALIDASGTKVGIQAQTYTAFTTAGTSTAYTLTPTPALTAYAAGPSFWITLHTTSGASPTLDISGLGATVNIVRRLQDGSLQNVSSLPAGAYRITLVSATQALAESVQPLIVGTVSQSGGVPTGAIIETGSNANGDYTKWADGTMVCRFRTSFSASIGTAFQGGFRSGSNNWTFPVAFAAASTPHCTVATYALSAMGAQIAATPSNTVAAYVVTSNSSEAGADRFVELRAEGIWF